MGLFEAYCILAGTFFLPVCLLMLTATIWNIRDLKNLIDELDGTIEKFQREVKTLRNSQASYSGRIEQLRAEHDVTVGILEENIYKRLAGHVDRLYGRWMKAKHTVQNVLLSLPDWEKQLEESRHLGEEDRVKLIRLCRWYLK